MKYCNKCKTEKNDTDFAKDRTKSDGLQTICRSCRSAAIRSKRDKLDPSRVSRREEREHKRLDEEARAIERREKRLARETNFELEKIRSSKATFDRLMSKGVILKCTHCGTEDQDKFTDSKKNKRIKRIRKILRKDAIADRIIRLDWCKDCQRKKDAEKRKERNNNFDPSVVVICSKCGASGDLSSGLFKPNKYRQAAANNRKKKPHLLCRHCNNNDPKRRIVRNIRNRMKACIYEIQGKVKKIFDKRIGVNSEDIIGCVLDEFREYIESRFPEGMTWDNYGEWHIDHVVPLSHFKIVDENNMCINIEEAKKANHYTNLQPLWAEDNLKKSNRYSK